MEPARVSSVVHVLNQSRNASRSAAVTLFTTHSSHSVFTWAMLRGAVPTLSRNLSKHTDVQHAYTNTHSKHIHARKIR